MGGENGVGVEIPKSLYVRTGSVTFEVCDGNGCESAAKSLGDLGAKPFGRGALASFDDFGRDFEPGVVQVKVELLGSNGSIIAAREQEIELSRYYPNGKRCDGDGSVSGAVKLRVGDRV
jgi:hypothetical protein